MNTYQHLKYTLEEREKHNREGSGSYSSKRIGKTITWLYSCGTFRSNRKGCPAYGYTQERAVILLWLWQNNWPVTLISTKSDTTTTNSVVHKTWDGTTATYSCPDLLVLYNENMGGVDCNDQLRGYYHVQYKCSNTTSMWFGSCFTWESRTLTY